MGCRRFVVSGQVQGVWFRASTREQAARLGITGHAVNLADGRVEVVACGTDVALDELAAWLTRGPELARVDKVTSEALAEQAFAGFRTG
ncbi:MAG: acylphosphatase [Gammaproteobacteria bacterium]|nr:acylphosphatase [Gammaproteobacteria bacterium]